MPRNRDLFDDSTMTFGEHLEVLRTHVWRALIGMIIGVILCLFLGNYLVEFLRIPIDDALRRNNKAVATDDLGGGEFWSFVTDFFSGKDKEKTSQEPQEAPGELQNDELIVQVPLESLRDAIESVAPGTTVAPSAPPEQGDSQEPTTEDQGPAVGGDEADKTDGDSADEAPEQVDSDPRVMVPLILKSPEIAQFRATSEARNRPVALKVEEAFLTYIKVSMVAGFALTSPWIFYQIWLFVAAGLFPHERKYVHTYLPMSLTLFLAGAAFCFFLVLPFVLDFLISFNEWMGIALQPRLSEYISFVIMMPVMFGISFQLPLVMLFLERIGIMTVEGYSENWRMAVLVIAIVSMLLTPSDPQSMLLMMLPLVFLYIGGIQLCKFRVNKNADPLA
ncbi:MAG: twin-arginine translocase subunit TatC [Planctomycetaceae bacterium]|nr:twin-arginine translocase subunit TatC [Planctomycetaceae bacterium]